MRACKRAMGEGQAPAPHILPISQLPDYRWRRQAAPSSRFSLVAEHLACNQKVASSILAAGSLFTAWHVSIDDPHGDKLDGGVKLLGP